METKTPAGQRVRAWFQDNATVISRPMEALDFDAIAQSALDRADRPRDDLDVTVEDFLAHALAVELGMIEMPHEWWVNVIRTMFARSDARKMALKVGENLSGMPGEGMNGFFIGVPANGEMIFPRAVFYLRAEEPEEPNAWAHE